MRGPGLSKGEGLGKDRIAWQAWSNTRREVVLERKEKASRATLLGRGRLIFKQRHFAQDLSKGRSSAWLWLDRKEVAQRPAWARKGNTALKDRGFGRFSSGSLPGGWYFSKPILQERIEASSGSGESGVLESYSSQR